MLTGTVFTVTSLADDAATTGATSDGQLTLREAIEAANTNVLFDDIPLAGAVPSDDDGDGINDAGIDVIRFAPDLIGRTLTLEQGEFTIGEDVRIELGGFTINADNLSRHFDIAGGRVILSGGTLTGGEESGDGGSVNVEDGGTLVVENTVFSGNIAGDNGGVAQVEDGGTLALYFSTLSDNQAGNSGGAISVGEGGTLRVIESTIQQNVAGTADGTDGNGGGIANDGGDTQVFDSSVDANSARGVGGGIHSSGGVLVVADRSGGLGSVSANASLGGGGGIAVDGGIGYVVGATIEDNNAGNAVFDDTTETSDGPVDGGGVRVLGTGTIFVIDNGTLVDNLANGDGAGAFVGPGARFILRNGTEVTGNVADGTGGGVHVEGRLDVWLQSTVTQNTASSLDRVTPGGGIWIGDGAFATRTLDIDGEDISGNTGGDVGGPSDDDPINATPPTAFTFTGSASTGEFGPPTPSANAPAVFPPYDASEFTTTASGLQFRIIRQGTGPTFGATDAPRLQTEGQFADGEVFQEFDAVLTSPLTSYIAGFSEGVQLIGEGGAIQVAIPPELGFTNAPPGDQFFGVPVFFSIESVPLA